MIVGLKGLIIKNRTTDIELEVNDITYKVFVSIITNEEISKISNGEKVSLLVEQVFKEDSQNLYGFSKEEEKNLFISLLKISGIGPKVAMAICSTFTVSDFIKIIQNSDIDSVKKIPGIGPKTSGRLLIELKDLKININEDKVDNSRYDIEQKTISALSNLGFKKINIEKILKTCTSNNSSELIKEVLIKIR